MDPVFDRLASLLCTENGVGDMASDEIVRLRTLLYGRTKRRTVYCQELINGTIVQSQFDSE